MNRERILRRNNVRIEGEGRQTLILAHGFGCDQTMWRYLVPLLKDRYRLVLFDYVGSGGSDVSMFERDRYSSLEAYADDIIDVCSSLELDKAVLVGHSVSSMIGLIASLRTPALFDRLVMVCPSPCFLNLPPDYRGGFEEQDLRELLDMMDKNYLGWASFLAPVVMGSEAPRPLVEDLSESFCSMDQQAAKAFAEATFLSDYRHILPDVMHPTLILQSGTDALASPEVGQYMHRRMPGSELLVIPADGHCLHMTHPRAVAAAIEDFCAAGAAR